MSPSPAPLPSPNTLHRLLAPVLFCSLGTISPPFCRGRGGFHKQSANRVPQLLSCCRDTNPTPAAHRGEADVGSGPAPRQELKGPGRGKGAQPERAKKQEGREEAGRGYGTPQVTCGLSSRPHGLAAHSVSSLQMNPNPVTQAPSTPVRLWGTFHL